MTVATAVLTALPDVVPPPWKAVVLAVSTAAYSISRGLAKMPASTTTTPTPERK